MAWYPDPKNESHYIGRAVGGFMFKPLDDVEEAEFREYARLHGPGKSDLSILHPVCREEWEKQAADEAKNQADAAWVKDNPELVDDRFHPCNVDGYSIDPAETRQLGNVYATLSAYAEHSARSMEMRMEGDIDAALSHERCMDRLYVTLPEWARW